MASDATVMQQAISADGSLPRRARTRQGKARLLTLDALDSRTAAAQAVRKLIASLTADLGGEDQLSAQERQLVMRAAMTGAIVADFETRWIAGQAVDLAEYLSAVNVQRRVLATIGLQRRAKNVGGLTLGELWQLDDAEQQREAAAARAAALQGRRSSGARQSGEPLLESPGDEGAPVSPCENAPLTEDD